VLIEVVTTVSAAHVAAFARLLPQLSASAAPLTRAALEHIAGAEANTLFVASVDDTIVGACLLVSFPAPTGVRCMLEDVVVDESARGAGVGSALVGAVLSAARAAGARTVDLTSRPSREAANRLYARCGFVQRTTNVWRRELQS
jgi:ribosomal protein S18 acetylase RimI-like enzyme